MYESPHNPSRTSRLTLRANDLFWRRYFRAKLNGWIARFTGKSREIALLSDAVSSADYRLVEIRERQALRLDDVAGSEGRVDEYDCDFYPRHRRDKQRWIGVCVSMMKDRSQMPPVEVIAVDGCYYVKDGHHRISVAKALDYIFLDADIAIWEKAE